MFQNFEQIVSKARELGPLKAAILFPGDSGVMAATAEGMKEGLITPILVGEKEHIRAVASGSDLPLGGMKIINEKEPQAAADLCLDMVLKGDVKLVVKGQILTTYLYRALIKATKKLAPDQTPCTICFHQVAGINKIFAITDPGVNIRPDLASKQKILANVINLVRRLGLDSPHAMVLAATHFDGSSCISYDDAKKLRRLGEEGTFGRCKIDLETNLLGILEEGNIKTERFPDIFLVPNIETGNILAKTIDHHLGGIRQCVTVSGGLITLTPSRSDGYDVRMINLGLGLVLAASGME